MTATMSAAELTGRVQDATGLLLGNGSATLQQSALRAHPGRLLESSDPLLGCFSVERPQGNRNRAHVVHLISLESHSRFEPQDSSTLHPRKVRSPRQSWYGKPST